MMKLSIVLLLGCLSIASAGAQQQAPNINTFPTTSHSWPANQYQPFCPLAFANPLVGSATACAANPQSSPQVFDVPLTGNTTWSKPTGLTSGESVLYRFAQDATGGRTVTLPTDGSIIVPNALICTGSGTPGASCLAANTLALTGTALSVDYVGCVGHGGSAPSWTATAMECLGISPNLTGPPITLVVSTSQAGSAANAVTTPAINDSGANLVVVAVADYTGNSVGTLTDSSSNSWGAPTINKADGNTGRILLWYRYGPTTSASHTYTYTTSGNNSAPIGVLAFKNSTGSAIDQSTSNAGSGAVTSLATGSITPTASGEVIVSALQNETNAISSPTLNNGTISTSLPFVNGTSYGLLMGYYVQPLAGAINQTFTWSNAADAAGTTASFK